MIVPGYGASIYPQLYDQIYGRFKIISSPYKSILIGKK